jgi:hypothetical protein
MSRISLQLSIWLAVLGVWVIVSRDHHPTLLIDVLATSVLVAASAAAVYVNSVVLWPRGLRRRTKWRYILELIGVVLALDVIAVMLIQVLYDKLWGPDPSRYGIARNLIYEAIFITFHLVLATGVLSLTRRRSATV